MISYTKRYVNIVSLIITMLIYILIINFIFLPLKNDFIIPHISNIFRRNTVLVELNSNNINQDTKDDLEIQNNHENIKTEETKVATKESNWKIKIPKISLEADISEGTGKDVMDKYVGHFEETSRKSGNVGLAAHNRGYAVNYFARIKELKEGDELIYKCDEFEEKYVVVQNKIIADTDWDDLEETEENKITLITCVENEPEYRRCVQGVKE